jgi:sphinganine-1-phosphate aldolase
MEKTTTYHSFPEKGIPKNTILAELRRMRHKDMDWRAGRTWSLVYYIDEPHLELLTEAHNLFFSENTINPFAFQSVRRMEREVTAMTAALLNGDEQTVGVMTAGGTESIFMAVYTYRERARKERRRIKQPEMVVPASIHPAFFKAAHMLGIRVRKVALTEDLCADPAAMEAAINDQTIMLAASAPAFPYGIVDPLPEISEIAGRHGLPLHVDACVGGFMLPWVERLGYSVPTWDFRLPHVTSISADIHKFGYGSKGASVLVYRSMDFLRHQFYILPDWCGGIYVSPTLLGTRSVGPIAAGWAAMKSLGAEGYLRVAEKVMTATVRIKAELEAIPEIRILGNPTMNLLAYATHRNKPDIFVIGDHLQKKGWMVDRQQNPNSIHLMLMSHNIKVIDEYLSDLREAIDYADAHPHATAKGDAAVYGLMARIPFKGVVEQNVRQVFEDLYSPEGTQEVELEEAPAWQGWLNRLLTGWNRLFGKQ